MRRRIEVVILARTYRVNKGRYEPNAQKNRHWHEDDQDTHIGLREPQTEADKTVSELRGMMIAAQRGDIKPAAAITPAITL